MSPIGRRLPSDPSGGLSDRVVDNRHPCPTGELLHALLERLARVHDHVICSVRARDAGLLDPDLAGSRLADRNLLEPEHLRPAVW
jgi:hypothetical protein